MKQLTPPPSRSVGLTIILTIMSITLPDALVNRVSGHPTFQVGPSSISVGHDHLVPPNRLENARSDEFIRRGIREEIRDKYKKRYEAWKKELLSTEIGRRQWERYANATQFLLTITVADNTPHDARTERYEWTNSGTLSAATITLGSRIDEGYPAADNYPVIGSLATGGKFPSRKNVLAACKFAHEFGHVDQALAGNDFQRQKQLIHSYLTILLANGHARSERQLTGLVQQLGAPPIQIWSAWECRAEANALLYLRDKVSQKQLPASLLEIIAKNVTLSANGCAKSFVPELLVKARR